MLLSVTPGAPLEIVQEFVRLTIRVLPYLLLGALAGAVLQTFVPETWTARLFGPQRRRSLPTAVAAGAILPGCSCATIPMAAGLRRPGGPRLGTIGGFIFVSPLLSPITIALTWSMLGPRFMFARAVGAIAGSLVLGGLLNRFESWFAEGAAQPLPIAGGSQEIADECCSEPEASGPELLRTNLLSIMRRVVPYFLLGMVIAAALAVLVPEGSLPRFLGGAAGPGAYLLAALVGIPAYVCEGEEVPITYALLGQGLGSGPAFTFLLGSVGTCVPTILMSRKILGNRATVFYAAFWVLFAVGTGIIFQLAVAGA